MRILTEKQLGEIIANAQVQAFDAGARHGWECARLTFNHFLAQYGIEIQMVTQPQISVIDNQVDEIVEKKGF